MKIIIFGLGAVGGVIAAQAWLSGIPIVGIARGPHLEAMQRDGLLLVTPAGHSIAKFPVFETVASITIDDGDIILLTMKSQDTAAALAQLIAAGVRKQPIFCFQNGVENERIAQRFFENVYGATVILPADYATPGEVVAYGKPFGVFDIGRYPSGSDLAATNLCEILTQCGFPSTPRSDVMSSKYSKLLSNLRNIVDALFEDKALQQKWYRHIRHEGETVLTKAGVTWDQSDELIRGRFHMETVPNRSRIGSSTLQSIVRRTGSIETPFLNGEIVLLGRQYNVETPLNMLVCDLSQMVVTGKLAPQSASEDLMYFHLGYQVRSLDAD